MHEYPTRIRQRGRWQLPCPRIWLEETSEFGSACAHRHLFEAKARIEEGQRCGGHENHDAFENDEQRLIFDERTCPATAELGDAKDTADKYADGGKAERAQEEFERCRFPNRSDVGILVQDPMSLGAISSIDPERKVEGGQYKQKHSEHLEGKAGKHCRKKGQPKYIATYDSERVGVITISTY